MIDINNKKFWNIVKGVGILSIVIGHCCSFLVPFVYMYHLVIFFFAGGYFYNEEKYGDDPYKHLISKLKSNWPKYVIYSSIILILHNVLLKLGLLLETEHYGFSLFTTTMINILLFNNPENLSCALWFVPVYIFSAVIFGIIIYYSRKLKYQEEYKKNIVIIVSSIFCGLLGLYLNYRNINFLYHFQTAILVVPFFTIGYFVKKYIKDLNKYLNIIPFIICFIVLLYMSYKTNFRIDLTFNKIGNIFLFYIISLVGIYFCLYVAKIILKIPYVKNYFNLFGIYSFEIMAFHFLVIKIIDFIYAFSTGIWNSKIYGKFPYAFSNLWPVYIILGTSIPAIIFYIINKYNNIKIKENSKTEKLIKNKKVIIGLLIALIICVGIPMIKTGIMHNDELMSRLWSSQGFTTFYNHYFHEQIEKGRTLSSVIIPLTMYFGFIGQSTFSFKFFQILSIILCLVFMAKLLMKILKDKRIVILYSLIFLSFLQISFEPTVPNVFVTFYNISICALLYSMSLFWEYLETKKIKKLIISMIIFFVVELTYESFVTYVPIYLLLYIYKVGLKNIFKDFKALFLPICVGVLYLVLYVIFSKLFPSNYAGNQIDGINIIHSIKIVLELGYFSLPGSYITSPKYNYLFGLHLNYNAWDILRLIIFTILFTFIFIIAVKNKATEEKNINKISILKIIFISLCAIALPILPISVASMYQTMDLGYMTLGIPVSFFSYFASVLLVTIIVTYISNNFKYGKYIMLIFLLGMALFVQQMNNTFSTEANKDFKRIETIERFIDSGLFENSNVEKVYAKDLFKLNHSLFIHDSHWNNYAKVHNINTNFVNEEGNKESAKLYYFDDKNIFEYIYKENIYLISEDNLEDKYGMCIKDSNDFDLNKNWNLYELSNYDGKCNLFVNNRSNK